MTAAELAAERLAARTVDEILAAEARIAWAKAHDGEECPPNRYPPAAELATRPLQADARAETAELLAAAYPHGGTRQRWAWFTMQHPDGAPAPFAALMSMSAPPSLRMATVDVVHAGWCDLPEPRPRHPLAPAIDAWQRTAPVPVGADERRHQNVPAALAWTRHMILHHLPFDEADLTQAPPADAARFEVAHLPYLEPAASRLPWAVLDLLDFGASRGRNGPVPVPTRVGWELVLMPEPGAWHAEQATVTPTLGALYARVSPATKYVATRHGPLLYQAARWLNDPDNATWFRRNEQSRRSWW